MVASTPWVLRLRWSRPGVEISGFDADGRAPVYRELVIGRTRICDVRVNAVIGGRRGYVIRAGRSGCFLAHGRHIGRYRHNDGPLRDGDVALQPGDSITLLDCATGEPVVTVQLERGSAASSGSPV